MSHFIDFLPYFHLQLTHTRDIKSVIFYYCLYCILFRIILPVLYLSIEYWKQPYKAGAIVLNLTLRTFDFNKINNLLYIIWLLSRDMLDFKAFLFF